MGVVELNCGLVRGGEGRCRDFGFGIWDFWMSWLKGHLMRQGEHKWDFNMWTTPGVALDSNDSSTRSPMAIEMGMQYIGYIGKGLSLAVAIFWFFECVKMPWLCGVLGCLPSIRRRCCCRACLPAGCSWCGKMSKYRSKEIEASPENVSRCKPWAVLWCPRAVSVCLLRASAAPWGVGVIE